MATMAIDSVKLNEGMAAGLRVQVSKVIRAKRERVFEAWTKPEVIQQWFGPEGMTVPSVSADVRVGGAYRIEVAGAPGGVGEVRTSVATGVYREIVPDELLSFTWEGSWNAGEETLVTVTFSDTVGGTEVTILHERIGTEASVGGYEKGWSGSLNKLAGLLDG